VWERERPGEQPERIERCGQLTAECGTPLWRYRGLDDQGRRDLIAPADLAVGRRRRRDDGAGEGGRTAA